ncbi:hypothetical protein VNO77_36815 [Canavalia gladiata]|uniref:Uncharacterized protein n=1 Tax=Canavalia gladiata TaxID=3824 RepID=A0AAN9PVU2_CANGL
MTRLVTPTLIVRVTPFIHRSKPLLTTLSPSQTLSFAQFSSETSSCAPNASVAFHHRPAKLSCESTAKGGMCNVFLVGTHHGSKVFDLVVLEQGCKFGCIISCPYLQPPESKGRVSFSPFSAFLSIGIESYRRVQAIVSFLKPQVVFLELCDGRREMLTYGHEISEVDRKGETSYEFRVAYEEAIKYGGKVVLGDRPSEITSRRTWSKLPFWEKAKGIFFLSLYPVILPAVLLRKELNDDENDYEDSSDDDGNVDATMRTAAMMMVTLMLSKRLCFMNEIKGSLVGIVDMVLVLTYSAYHNHPDDLNPNTMEGWTFYPSFLYMSAKLIKVASVSSSVVAVVGKGHLRGVKRLWKQPVVVEDLLSLPSPKPAISAKRIFTSVRVAAAGVVIISGMYLSCKGCL